jgi:hypothetical protein
MGPLWFVQALLMFRRVKQQTKVTVLGNDGVAAHGKQSGHFAVSAIHDRAAFVDPPLFWLAFAKRSVEWKINSRKPIRNDSMRK